MKEENVDRLSALHEARARAGSILADLVPAGHRCGPITTTQEDWERLTASHEAEEAALAALMPTEQDAINLLHDAYTRFPRSSPTLTKP